MTRNTSARAFHVVRGDESTRIREEYSLYLENANVLFIICTGGRAIRGGECKNQIEEIQKDKSFCFSLSRITKSVNMYDSLSCFSVDLPGFHSS